MAETRGRAETAGLGSARGGHTVTRMRLGAVLLVLAWLMAPAAAMAQHLSDQVTSVTVDVSIADQNIDSSAQEYLINLEDCGSLAADANSDIQFTWRFSRTPPSGTLYSIKFVDNSEECTKTDTADISSDACVTDPDHRQQTLSGSTLSANLTWNQITGDTAGSDCANRSDTHDVTLVFESLTSSSSTTSTDTVEYDQVQFQFATTRPSAPTNLSAQGGESTIEVDWDGVSGADSYDVYYSTDPMTPGGEPENLVTFMANTSSSSATLSDSIQVGVTYYVAVSAIDTEGNPSLLSEVITVTTQRVTDFYEYYRGLGGRDQGCASVPTSTPPSVAGLALLAGLALWRMRRGHAGRGGRS